MAARKKPPRESAQARSTRALRILDTLSQTYPDAHCELDFQDPWQLLVAVVLSAQCTDANVNKATPALFRRYPAPRDMAAAEPTDVEPFIKTLGLYRNKAKNLITTARAVVEQHDGVVPDEREALEALAGVGRKTASVVLAEAYHQPALAVDTHVGRLSRRLGLTVHEDPNDVEQDLCALIPRERWRETHHALIWHGRRHCGARAPGCDDCPVLSDCPRVGVS
ncbi:MAG: endonuclease III [Myxococcota bacterium]